MKAVILVDNLTKGMLKKEWGLSVYIEHDGRRILLDTGASGAFAENAEALGISLEKVDAGVLSHAHYDHADGMAEFFARNETAPFYLRKGAGEDCYSRKWIFHRYIGIHRGFLSRFRDRIRYAGGKRGNTSGRLSASAYHTESGKKRKKCRDVRSPRRTLVP